MGKYQAQVVLYYMQAALVQIVLEPRYGTEIQNEWLGIWGRCFQYLWKVKILLAECQAETHGLFLDWIMKGSYFLNELSRPLRSFNRLYLAPLHYTSIELNRYKIQHSGTWCSCHSLNLIAYRICLLYLNTIVISNQSFVWGILKQIIHHDSLSQRLDWSRVVWKTSAIPIQDLRDSTHVLIWLQTPNDEQYVKSSYNHDWWQEGKNIAHNELRDRFLKWAGYVHFINDLELDLSMTVGRS